MEVQASPAEWPELKEVLGACQVRCRRPEGADALERSTTGRLPEWPNNNCAPLAHAVPGTSEQRRQEFLTTRPGDAEDLHGQRVQKMMAEATRSDGVWVWDATGWPQPGKASVGVARPDAGTLGKVGQCQRAVTWCDPAAQATWPVAVRLDGPNAWAADAKRRQRAHVPPQVPVQPTPELARSRLEHARGWRGPQPCVGADADEGANPHVLAGLEARQDRAGVGVRADFRGSPQRQATSPLPRADQRLQRLPRWPWRTIRWRQGPKGGRRQKFVARRCWRVTRNGQRPIGWLRGERATRGQPEERP
jgi:SRSO17 transposase